MHKVIADNVKITELRIVLQIAADHLKQYRRYSDEMRHIGRGITISSAYQPDTLDTLIREALSQ